MGKKTKQIKKLRGKVRRIKEKVDKLEERFDLLTSLLGAPSSPVKGIPGSKRYIKWASLFLRVVRHLVSWFGA